MDADGMVGVPHETPGLGVAVDADFIESLTTRVEVLTARQSAMASQ